MKAFIVFALLACAYAKPGFVSTYGGYPYTAAVAAPAYTTAYSTTTYHGGAAYAAHPYAAAPYAAATYAAAPYAAAPYVAAAPAVVAPAFTKTQYHAQDELGQASYGYAHPGQAHSAVRDAAGNVRGSYAYVNPDGNEIRVNYVADQGGFRVESNALPQAPVHVVPAPVAGPAPVLDTPEVVEARAAHFAAHAEANARSARKKRGVVALTHTPASTYASPAFPALAYSALAHPAPLAYTAAAYPAAYGYSAAALHHPALTYSAAYPAAYGYSAAAVLPTHHAVREATLTKVVNTPGHAVSYRVD